MRVFLDTNVLASAFATRGLCADVLRHVLAEQERVVGEIVIEELRRVLRTKLGVPAALVADIEEFLRSHDVIPKPDVMASVELRDPDDRLIVASAVAGGADLLVTGDRDLLDVADQLPIRVLGPRAFWDLVRTSRAPAG